MSDAYSVSELLAFLDHAAERGLLPAATAQALAVACRNVLGLLAEEEKTDVRELDLDAVTKRFHNKRARDFSGDTLKEYERRVHRAVKLFREWRDDPANFKAATRSTTPLKKRRTSSDADSGSGSTTTANGSFPTSALGGYQTAVPLGRDRVVTLLNVPVDLTTAEAERLARFVRLLAVDSPEAN